MSSTAPLWNILNKECMMKDTKAMIKKEVAFMKKKGAPKSMIKHEVAEARAMGVKKLPGNQKKGK